MGGFSTGRITRAAPIIAADNGLSVDGSTVELGQDVGAAGDPAELLNDREIPSGGFGIGISGDAQLGIGTASPSYPLHISLIRAATSGNEYGELIAVDFVPPSGNAPFATLGLLGEIDQSGGATGVVRSILINPTLTFAPIYIAVQVANNSGWAFYNSGGSANNWFNGLIAMGGVPSAIPLARQHMVDNVIDPGPRGSVIWDVTWNTASDVTAFLFNVALAGVGAGAGSKMIDIQLGGISRLVMDLSGNIVLGMGTADAASALQVNSTTQGVRFPNMTTVQRDAIAAPGAGLVIYNTTSGKLNVRTAAAWEEIQSL